MHASYFFSQQPTTDPFSATYPTYNQIKYESNKKVTRLVVGKSDPKNLSKFTSLKHVKIIQSGPELSNLKLPSATKSLWISDATVPFTHICEASSFNGLTHFSIKHSLAGSYPTCLNQLKNLVYLDLSYCESITSIDSLYFPKLQTLILGGTDIKALPANLKRINTLHTLDLSETQITSKSLLNLKPLSNLQILNLNECNKIDELSDSLLPGSLQQLRCSALDSLKTLRFYSSNQLNQIDASNNQKLHHVYIHPGSLQRLEKMDLWSNMQLTSVEGLEYLNKLKKLRLGLKPAAPIPALPASLVELDLLCINQSNFGPIESCKNLKTLDISTTVFNWQPLSPFTQLTSLDITSTYVSNINLHSNFPSLTTLGMHGIIEIPKLGNTKLKELDLSFSFLKKYSNLPTEIEALNLSQNKLSTIPKEVLNCNNLKSIDLTENPKLKNINILKDLPSLQHIYISKNSGISKETLDKNLLNKIHFQ